VSTLYSYFIHVSWYTRYSDMARSAMRMKTIRDTGEDNQEVLIRNR